MNRFLAILFCLFVFSGIASAQFKEEAFTQTYADPNDTTMVDSTAAMFSFKNYFRGIAHKEPVKIGTVLAGSTVFVGGGQIHNKQYWKLPIIYGGLGATVGAGVYYRNQFSSSLKDYKAAFELDPNTTATIDRKSQHISTYLFAGATAIWWGSLMDGMINFDKEKYPQPGKATVYSLLLPGLGQIYNKEYWKLPVYLGGIIGSVHYYSTNRTNYLKYKRIYNEAATPGSGYTGNIPAETAKYYRDVYRRYRDYSLLAIVGFYLLQAIDANVFAYMGDFEMDDNLAVSVGPTVIAPDNAYAMSPNQTGVGLRLGIKF